MEHAEMSGSSQEKPVEDRTLSPTLHAKEADHLPAGLEALPATGGRQKKEAERIVVTSKPAGSSLSSTERNKASDDSELGARLESLSSNHLLVPLPDVSDPAFDVRQWATTLIPAANANDVRFRKASFVFKGLDVSGLAAGATFQPTVASILLGPIALAKRLTGSRISRTKILNGFDGVVRSGEMLLVLGRPGSGCSTLLRTIAGELGNMKVGAQSTINYNGMDFAFCDKLQH
jgi:ABC-type multidrug transport system fused ATPase/permease subunit